MSIDTHFQKNFTECDKYDVEPYRIKIEELSGLREPTYTLEHIMTKRMVSVNETSVLLDHSK